MKRLLLFLLALMSLAGTANAWSWWNYPPDNEDVQLGSTNLPIVWLDVDGQVIDRYERITARMKIIHNGDGQLNYADTIRHPGSHLRLHQGRCLG